MMCQDEVEFGCRVLVGHIGGENEYIGVAEISNVEFVNCGQRGFTENYDPRFSLAFLDVGDTTDHGSYVKKCAFNVNYNVAVGVMATNNLVLEDNVIYRAFTDGVKDTGVANEWNRCAFAHFYNDAEQYLENYDLVTQESRCLRPF